MTQFPNENQNGQQEKKCQTVTSSDAVTFVVLNSEAIFYSIIVLSALLCALRLRSVSPACIGKFYHLYFTYIVVGNLKFGDLIRILDIESLAVFICSD